jgi:hypothetical protein
MGVNIDWGGIGQSALPIVGSVAGSLIQAHSAQQGNQSTAASIREQEQFQANQRATSYQTAVKDMEAAGLNPALAYQQGGATPMQGGSYQAQPNIKGNPVQDAIDAYNRWNTSTAQAEATRQQANLNQQMARKAYIEGTTEKLDSDLAQDPNYSLQYRRNRLATLGKGTQEALNYPEQFRVNQKAIEAQAASAQSLTNLNSQTYQRNQLETHLMQALDSTAKGITKKINPYIPDTMRLNP